MPVVLWLQLPVSFWGAVQAKVHAPAASCYFRRFCPFAQRTWIGKPAHPALPCACYDILTKQHPRAPVWGSNGIVGNVLSGAPKPCGRPVKRATGPSCAEPFTEPSCQLTGTEHKDQANPQQRLLSSAGKNGYAVLNEKKVDFQLAEVALKDPKTGLWHQLDDKPAWFTRLNPLGKARCAQVHLNE